MCARCAVMCRMESGPKFVRYAQPPKISLWNLNKALNSFREGFFLKYCLTGFTKMCRLQMVIVKGLI